MRPRAGASRSLPTPSSILRGLRVVAVIVGVLALFTWVALVIVNGTARRWFEKDVALRAELAVKGARRALVAHWTVGNWAEVSETLTDVTQDERIMAAAACTPGAQLVASTVEFPAQLRCDELTTPTRADEGFGGLERVVGEVPVHVSVIPVNAGDQALGFVALVHDLSFVERREATTRRFVWTGFALLTAAALLLATLASRWYRAGWSNDLRRLLRGEAQTPEFQPLLQDVRQLMDRLAAENDLDIGGAWNPLRLKNTLNRYLQGERVVIVANREPYIHNRSADGGVEVIHPASGLVTALEPVMRACSGVWVAHGSGSADRETVDRSDRVKVPPGEESYLLRRVWLTEEEEKGYYYGFSNEGLWPLCHMAYTRPEFRIDDWKHYQTVNRYFADAVVAEVDREDPIVLVQDYHFALLPGLLRQRLPRATIISFWHIPWPNAESFGVCPWRNAVLEGLLGSSILGFHTQLHCNNFIDAVDRFMEARIDRERTAVVHQGHTSLVRPYPISIEWPNRWARESPPAAECKRQVLEELGLPASTLLGVGVDRLDYTKGIDERLLAIERLLERSPEYRGRFTFVQLAAPSRTAIESYRLLNERVEATAARINQRFGRDGYRPILLLRAHHEPPRVFKFYRAADVCYVSSLHDGMNLVAKEFIAARDDERGVLMLSQFTGAARELTEALIVNPYDLEQASTALANALRMPAAEQADRMRALRTMVAEFNVYRWAGRMLADAARLRARERLSGKLAPPLIRIEGAA